MSMHPLLLVMFAFFVARKTVIDTITALIKYHRCLLRLSSENDDGDADDDNPPTPRKNFCRCNPVDPPYHCSTRIGTPPSPQSVLCCLQKPPLKGAEPTRQGRCGTCQNEFQGFHGVIWVPINVTIGATMRVHFSFKGLGLERLSFRVQRGLGLGGILGKPATQDEAIGLGVRLRRDQAPFFPTALDPTWTLHPNPKP